MYLTAVKSTLKDIFNWESSSLISVAGLAIAFTTVFFIYSRVSFESGYDSHHEKADRIYRISGEILTAGSEARHAVLGPFMGRGLKEHFPVVEEFARLLPNYSTIILEREEAKFSVDEAYFVDPSVFQVFTIDFVHGDINTALAGPREVVINQSLSNQMFGTENPIGSILNDGDNVLTVTGVINDSPKNSHHKLNVLFSHQNPDFYPEDEPAVRLSEGYWMPSAYHFILLVPCADIEEITDHFEPFFDKYMSPFGEAINATFNPLAIPHREGQYQFWQGVNNLSIYPYNSADTLCHHYVKTDAIFG